MYYCNVKKGKNMIWIRLVTSLISILLFGYYAMLVMQLFDMFKFTDRKFTFVRCIIPFYYWIAPYKEKKK